MTVRGVDMQTMIPKLTEASRMQHQAEQQANVAQHGQAAQLQAQAQRAQQQVAHRDPSGKVAARKDGQGQGGGRDRGEQQPRRGKAEEAKQPPAEPGLGTRLDVKL